MAQILLPESKSVYSFNKCGCYSSYVPGTVHGTGLSVDDSDINDIFFLPLNIVPPKRNKELNI